METNFNPKILGQLRPSDINAVSLVNPDKFAFVSGVIIANTTTNAVSYRIFVDDDGTTYDESTALYYDIALPANTTHWQEFDPKLPLNSSGANLAVRTSNANAITFTAYGADRIT